MGALEIHDGTPHPALAPFVRRYSGYVERTPGPLTRRELPSGETVLIIGLGPALRISGPLDHQHPQDVASFVAAMHDTYALTEHQGFQSGIQVDFTPLGAHLFLRVPMHELAGRVVALEDVLGPAAPLLVERLQHTATWPARLALLDTVVARRMAAAPAPAPGVAWAWRRIVETHGAVEIGVLSAELGWSRKRLVAGFREQVGLAPKAAAQVVRFASAVRLLDEAVRRPAEGPLPSFAEVALARGYFDQAHFNRDVRRFAGLTPTELVRDRWTTSTSTPGLREAAA